MKNSTTLPNPNPRRWERMIVASIMIVGTCAIIGAGLGVCQGIGYITQTNPWKSMGRPPALATKVLFADVSTVYVQTAAGQIYECCWSPAQVPTTSTNRDCDPSRTEPAPLPIAPPPLPGTVVDRHEVAKIIESCEHVVYAVLDDGSVWRWQYSMSFLKEVMPFIDGVMGFVAGLIVGTGVAMILSLFTILFRITMR